MVLGGVLSHRGRARRRAVVLSARKYILHIRTRPTVAWGPPPGAYRARAGSRTILVYATYTRSGKGLTTDVKDKGDTRQKDKKRQPGTSTRLPRPSWCRYVIFQFAEVAYPTSVNLVNGAVACTRLPRHSQEVGVADHVEVIPTHHSRATDGLFSAPRYRTSTTLLEVLVVLPTAWIRTRVHPSASRPCRYLLGC